MLHRKPPENIAKYRYKYTCIALCTLSFLYVPGLAIGLSLAGGIILGAIVPVIMLIKQLSSYSSF